jgi:hypothetical protein
MVSDSECARNGTTTDVMDVVGNAWTDRQLFARYLRTTGVDSGPHVGSNALESAQFCERRTDALFNATAAIRPFVMTMRATARPRWFWRQSRSAM